MLKTENLTNNLQKFFRLRLFTNGYVLVVIVFVIWISFLDRNNLMSVWRLNQMIDELEEEKDFYLEETEKLKKRLTYMRNNPEKYARETYFLHKDDEIVYLIR